MAEQSPPDGVDTVLSQAITQLQNFKFDGSTLMSREGFDELLSNVAQHITAGKWLLGNAREEAEYRARARQEEQAITVGDSEEDDESDQEVCRKCFEGGLLLVCDGCASLWHLHCVSLDDIPEDQWMCRRCVMEDMLAQARGEANGEEKSEEPDTTEADAEDSEDLDHNKEIAEADAEVAAAVDPEADAEVAAAVDPEAGAEAGAEAHDLGNDPTITDAEKEAEDPEKNETNPEDEEDLDDDEAKYEEDEEEEEEAEEDQDEEITIGDLRVRNPKLLRIPDGTIQLSSGESYQMAHYLGQQHLQLIEDLYAVPAVPTDPNMLVTPHDYQAKGAAQIQHCAEGPFRGMILGDGMGLGKTLTGAMAMNIVRDQPGMCLVVCLAKDRVQWHNTITNSWKEGYGSKSFILRDPRTTACQLLSLGVDVVICSYEYVENSVREAIRNHIKFVKVREARGNLERNLKRPCKTLFSEVYGLTGQLWKRLILDEAQTVSKPGQAKHDAIKKIPAEAIICLTGTLAHNKWHDFWGYIDYFKGHPFESAELFFHAFGNTEGQFADPESKQIRRLQRFMQPLIIARPRETNPLLTLVDRDSYKLCFELHPMCEGLVNEYISKYFRMLRNNKLNGADAWEGKGSRSVRLKCLSYATKAQLASLHPLLLLNIRVKTSTTDAEDGEDHQWSSLEETGGDPAFTSRKQRLAWLELVQSASLRLAEDSERTVHILALYQWCRKHKPQEKIVIFSQYLKFLDIIHQCLERIGVEAIRYDGLVKVTDRPQVEKQFIKADPSVPLLITAGAGGTGLNLQCASIVIQTEVWWNHNTELQAIARCDRQGQKKRVLYVRLFAENSKIDAEYLQVQSRKRKVNEELMKPLIRCHNEGPEILELEDRLPLPVWYDDDLDLQIKLARRKAQKKSKS